MKIMNAKGVTEKYWQAGGKPNNVYNRKNI